MKKSILWPALSLLVGVSLLAAACSSPTETTTTPATTSRPVTTTAATTTKPATTAPTSSEPQYGGTIALILNTDPIFDLLQLGKAAPHMMSHNYLWDADWTRGPAGGYGTKEFSYTESVNIPSINIGHLAEKIDFNFRSDAQEVDTVITVRQGIHYALDPENEASRLANGREVTADDVLFCLNDFQSNPDSMNAKLFPMMREKLGTKTGPWEVTFTFPYSQHLDATMRLLGLTIIYPPEVYQKYGAAFSDPKNDVGTGPYIIKDYVSGSMVSMTKNDNYWEKDPIGPGKGNQLPYIENLKYYIIADLSTREAALRSGKVDELGGFVPEDAEQMSKTAPDLMKAPASTWSISPMYMRIDREDLPFKDVRVRRAMMMATDFNAINDGLYGGTGQILSWPTWRANGYEGLYLGLDDPEMPDTVKELYTYSPDKAMQLLADAGYPSGFKATLTLTNDERQIDYYSIVKEQWSKVGIGLDLNIIEPGNLVPVAAGRNYDLLALFYAPNSTWPEQANYTNTSNWVNGSVVDDPYVNEEATKARVAAMTDFQGAMSITKNLMKYLLDQAYCIPTPRYPQYNMWWPWLKNYSGETSVGYFAGQSWVKYIWIDQAMKQSMGH